MKLKKLSKKLKEIERETETCLENLQRELSETMQYFFTQIAELKEEIEKHD